MRIVLRSGGQVRTVTVIRRESELLVTLDDGTAASVRWLTRDDGRLVLERDGRRDAVWAARPNVRGGDRQLWISGRTLAYSVDDPTAVRGLKSADLGLHATIPAVVLEVLVAPGAHVVEGDRLLLLESMKMVMPIVATSAGTVKAILCEVGAAVGASTPLVDFIPDDAAAPGSAAGPDGAVLPDGAARA